MATKPKPTKIVKGGFRATLALIISLFALALSIIAYTNAVREEALKAQVKDLQATLEKIKTESTEQFEKLRTETAKALEKASRMVEVEEAGKMPAKGSSSGAKD